MLMIDFSNLLNESVIFDALQADSRHAVLRKLSEALAERSGIDSRIILEAVTLRERLGSTGVGEGVAIPHVRLAGIDTPIGAFARLATPVDFEAVDEAACDLVFMLLAPDTEGSAHLKALAQVSRVFRQSGFRDELRGASDVGTMSNLLLGQIKRGHAA